jgi:hypothetical protein
MRELDPLSCDHFYPEWRIEHHFCEDLMTM